MPDAVHAPSAPAGPPLLAIVCAMDEEWRALHSGLADARVVHLGGRAFHLGQWAGRPVVLALSGIGKVAAATTTTLLLSHFGAEALLFTGVAGGLAPQVRVGDVVVAGTLLQHDMDASPLFPRFEVPLTGRAEFPVDSALADGLHAACEAALQPGGPGFPGAALAALGLGAVPPRVHRGLIVSGDRFVSGAAESAALRAALPQALAVEMEGAAVAQVCADFGRPFGVVRTLSDRADDSAHLDFQRFIHEVAAVYTRLIVQHWLAGPGAQAHFAPRPTLT